MCVVLSSVESKQDETYTTSIFRQVLSEIYQRLATVQVAYPTPIRISLSRCLELISDYLESRSRGDRLLALTAALFSVIGQRFQLYSVVRRANITAADQSTGLLADFECVDEEGTVVIVVEVKDRVLTISQIRGKIPNIRERQVAEIFFIAQQGTPIEEATEIDGLIAHEFISGHNIYITDLTTLASSSLALLGEDSRREFLTAIGFQLDQYGSAIQHRQAWAQLLQAV